jgi:hypothetical protein
MEFVLELLMQKGKSETNAKFSFGNLLESNNLESWVISSLFI